REAPHSARPADGNTCEPTSAGATREEPARSTADSDAACRRAVESRSATGRSSQRELSLHLIPIEWVEERGRLEPDQFLARESGVLVEDQILAGESLEIRLGLLGHRRSILILGHPEG